MLELFKFSEKKKEENYTPCRPNRDIIDSVVVGKGKKNLPVAISQRGKPKVARLG